MINRKNGCLIINDTVLYQDDIPVDDTIKAVRLMCESATGKIYEGRLTLVCNSVDVCIELLDNEQAKLIYLSYEDAKSFFEAAKARLDDIVKSREAK